MSERRDPDREMMEWWLRNRGDVDQFVDRDVNRSCSSKTPYSSEDDARAHVAMNGMQGRLFSYHCVYCDMWHLTKRKPP